MALCVTRRMDNRDSTRHRDLIPTAYKYICLRRRYSGWFRRDDHAKQECVEGPWGGKEATHCPAFGDEHGVSSVHVDAGRGQILELGEATGVIGVAVRDKNVPDIGDGSPQGVYCLRDPDCAAGYASVHENQTVRFRVEEEGVDPRQTYLMQPGLEFFNTHRGWLSWGGGPGDTQGPGLFHSVLVLPELMNVHVFDLERVSVDAHDIVVADLEHLYWRKGDDPKQDALWIEHEKVDRT